MEKVSRNNMEKARLNVYLVFSDLIKAGDIVLIDEFVKKQDITPEGYYSSYVWTKDQSSSVRKSMCKNVPFSPAYPLNAAASIGSPEVLTYLISLGFDPNGTCLLNDRRPIHSACMKCTSEIDEESQSRADSLELVRILIEDHEVNVNVIDEMYRRYTPLLYAAEDGRSEVVKMLVGAGAVLSARESKKDRTALHLAAKSGYSDVCELLIWLGMNVNETDINGFMPLHYAAYHGRVTVAEVLLDAGANVNGMNEWGCSPLGSAFHGRGLSVVRVLCSRGANIDHDGESKSFLHEAICKGNYDILWYLVVERGVSLDHKDSNNNTPLSLAVQTDDIEAANILISCGCKTDKDTFLHVIPHNKKWETFVKKVQVMSSCPRKLLDICCLTIRRLLAGDIIGSVAALYLPNPLKDVLLLKHDIFPGEDSQSHTIFTPADMSMWSA